MTTHIELSEDAFAAIFRPVANHLNPHASYDWGQGYGTLFETYGEELAFVQSQPGANIWTLLSGDGDYITSGCHFVNRVGYFITDVPVPDDLTIEVPLPEPDEEGNTPQLSPRLATSLRNVINYLWEDEHRDYHATDPCNRRSHIFRSLNALNQWLAREESTIDGGRVAP